MQHKLAVANVGRVLCIYAIDLFGRIQLVNKPDRFMLSKSNMATGLEAETAPLTFI